MLTHVRIVVDYADTVSTKSKTMQTQFFANIFAKTTKFAKPVLPDHMGPGGVFYITKMSKIS